jgi:hypothetical protein
LGAVSDAVDRIRARAHLARERFELLGQALRLREQALGVSRQRREIVERRTELLLEGDQSVGQALHAGQRARQAVLVLVAEQRVQAQGNVVDAHQQELARVTELLEHRRPHVDPRGRRPTGRDRPAELALVVDLHEGQAGNSLRTEAREGAIRDRRPRRDGDVDQNDLRRVGIEAHAGHAADVDPAVAHGGLRIEPRYGVSRDQDVGYARLTVAPPVPDDRPNQRRDQPERE